MSGTDEKIISKQLLSGNSGELPSACQNPIGSFFGSKIAFFTKKFGPPSPPSSVDANFEPIFTSRFFLSAFWIFLTKLAIVKVLVALAMIGSAYLRQEWTLHERQYSLTSDETIYVTTRQCKVVISDSFRFKSVRTRTMKPIDFRDVSYFDSRSNNLWHENTGVNAKCIIEIPIARNHSSFNISCGDYCLVQVMTIWNSTISELFIAGNELSLKAKDVQIDSVSLVGRKIKVWGRDFTNQVFFVSAIYFSLHLNYFYKNESSILGLLPNSTSLGSNMDISQLGRSSLKSYIDSYIREDFIGIHWDSSFMISRLTPISNSTDLTLVCIKDWGVPCYSRQNSFLIFANQSDISIRNSEESSIKPGEFVSTAEFKLRDKQEYDLSVMASRVPKNGYMILEFPDLSFEDQSAFKVFAYSGYLLPLAAENFLQITQACKIMNSHRMEELSVSLQLNNDQSLIEFLSKEERIAFFTKLKNFIVEKLNKLSGRGGWEVVVAYPMGRDDRIYNPQLRVWVCFNIAVFLIVCAISGFVLYKMKKFGEKVIEREFKNIEKNEMLLKQLTRENFMFLDIAEILRPNTEPTEKNLPILLNFFSLGKLGERLSSYFSAISEQDFVELIVDLQPPNPESKLTFSKVFDACYIFYIQRGVQAHSLKAQDLQEALLSAGLLLQSNKSEPEYYITGRKLHSFHRGTLFKDKLFISMDLQVNSLEYFIQNHCKPSQNESDSISFAEFSGAYSVFCSATSANKQAFDETLLRELYEFQIKKMPLVEVCQGPPNKSGKCPSLKLEFIEALSKNLPYTSVIGKTGPLSAKANYARSMIIFVTLNLLEVIIISMILSSRKYLVFLFDIGITPRAISMYNDSKNVGLANMIASTSYEIERILIYYLPLYVSDLFIFFSTYYNITGRRVENLKRLSVFFGWILIVYFAIGVFLFIGLQVFEIFMFFFAAFQGPEHIIDLIVTLVKYSLTIYGFFSARRAIRNTKRQIKSQIDFYFMNLSNDFLEEKNRKAKKKEAEASEQRFKVSETLNSWMEQKKVSISYSLRRTKTTCSLIVESLKEPLNSEKLTVFISEVLGLDPSTPLVRLLVMLIELRSEKISKVELSSRLETLNSLFFLTICEGNEQHAQLFSCFINIYTANHNQNIEDLLYHSSKFFKQVIKPDSHKIIDLYLPLFISICYEDFYSSFSETSLRNLNNYLQALHPRLKHTFSEVPSYINHEIELARQKISQGRIDKSLNFTLDWSDIMNTVPDHLFQEIRTRNEDLKIVISDFFSEVHGPKSRKYLAESFAKVYELDPDLLKLFCDLILGLGCGEVDFTSVELKSNPYFRALKKRFKLSAIQLSGIFNITRNIFDSETSALYILHLLSRKYPLTLSLRFQFILMLFDRKSSLKHHIEAMMVPEPGLLYYSLTTRIFSISRAFEFFSNKSESRRALLKAILDSSPQKDLLEGKITAQNKLFLLEDQPLSEFIELCGVYMKLRNFNFDLGISAMMAVAPALKSIEKEDENQLFEVIQHIRSIRYKIKSSFISFETVSAMRAISLLENLERLSSSDLKTHYGFLADPLFNWDHIVNFLYKCRRHIGFSETTPCSALDTDLANFFTGEARSARLFKAILLQLKPFLPPSERKLIAKIEIDVSAFSLRTKTLSGRENPDPTARDLRPRVRNLIYRLFLTGEESSATIIYAFYFCIGILRRKDTVFSDFLEDNIARAFEVEPLLIRLIGQLGNPRVAEDPHELVFPLRDLLMALPEVAGSFHLKSIVTSVFRPDFVGNLGRIIKGQAGLEGFFEREVKDEALAGLLGLLVDLKLGQGAAFPHKALLFSQSLLEKYSLDVKEVIDLYNLCKRKGIDFAEYMVSGARKDSTDLFKSFLIAQSKLQLADSESQRQFLLHHSSLFKLLGLNEQVCWPALLARRGNFRLMRRFLRGQIRDQSLGGTTQQDLLEELLTLTHRARRILKGRSTGSGPASPALNCNVWLERLAALHGDPQGLAASTKSLGNSLSGFAYSVFLTVKYSPPRLAEYLFDFAFFTMAGKLVARKGHRRWKGPPPPAAAVDRRRRDLAGLLPALIRGGAIFPPYGKLCSMVSVSERKLFDSLLVEEGGKDPEAAYNEAVCVRLMRGWWMRLKDEAMKAELGPFVETAGKASLQELAFGGIQPPLNNAVYFASFVRFIEEDLCGCLCDLSRLNPGGVLRVEGLRGCGVDHEFGGSLFITIFVSKLGEASLAQGEGMYDQYASVVRNADLLFRFVEKQLFFLNGISIARKDFLLQQYLTYFGLILKPQHSVVLSPSLWSPCAAAYALRKMKKAGLGKNESVRELLVGFFKVDREIQEEIKVKVLAKVLETDLDNAKAGQQTQMFRQFYVDEPGVESLSSEALSGSGPLRRDSGSFAPRKDSGPPRKDSGSIYQRKDLGLTRLPDSGPADLSLYSPTASMDLGQLESFHYLSTVTRGRVGRGLYSLFERLNPWMFDKTLYEFELLSSGLARSKFGDSGEIFSAFFGIPLEEQSKLRFFQLSYFSLGRGCRVFDVRVDWKGEGPSFALLDGETRVQLRRVAALQSAAGAWNTANFLAAVKSSEARLRSRHAALGVVCEFLFASTPRCWLIRCARAF